ncbi:hypothetical protein F5050DRAFT_969487 [Lentinula boryana]|uniref:DUF6533 domain-containing protein n=1 Tax=Lentinula boryana TaxID=40481 RepID=A0ABQ8QLL4_9AGAR|nr:hypothetical protein F5050DRAFT_969487 [Lentinula boryana]
MSLVSCAALLVYDYCLTLDLERKFVWSKPCKWSNVLYLVQRYLPLVDTVILFTISTFSSNTGHCDSIFDASLWLHFVGTSLSEMLLSMRVYAISRGRFKHLGYFMSACFAMIFVVNIVVATTFHTRGNSFPPPPPRGCLHIDSPISFTLFITSFILYDCGGFVLTIRPAILGYKNRKFLKLYDAVYREGIHQFVLFCVMCGIEFALAYGISIELHFLCMPILRALHSITTSRIVLNIREAMDITSVEFYSETPDLESFNRTNISARIVFATDPVEIEFR